MQELDAANEEFKQYQTDVAVELDEFESQVESLQAEVKDKNEEIERLEDEAIKLKVNHLGGPIYNTPSQNPALTVQSPLSTHPSHLITFSLTHPPPSLNPLP